MSFHLMTAPLALCLASTLALAQPPPAEAPAELPPAKAQQPGEIDRWDEAHVKVPPWTRRSGQGVGIGYQHGSWAGHWVQELRLRVPFARAFAVGASGVYLQDEGAGLHNLGGRLLLMGGTPVYLNLVRIYGGGGVELLTTMNRGALGSVGGEPMSPTMWGGGGFFGFEFFISPLTSFFIEIGGRGSSRYSGATITAGMNFFPFS